MKKVEPPLDLDATYEDVGGGHGVSRLAPLTFVLTPFHQSVSRLSQIKEYADVPDEEDRRQAFQKFVKRQKVRSFHLYPCVVLG